MGDYPSLRNGPSAGFSAAQTKVVMSRFARLKVRGDLKEDPWRPAAVDIGVNQGLR